MEKPFSVQTMCVPYPLAWRLLSKAVFAKRFGQTSQASVGVGIASSIALIMYGAKFLCHTQARL